MSKEFQDEVDEWRLLHLYLEVDDYIQESWLRTHKERFEQREYTKSYSWVTVVDGSLCHLKGIFQTDDRVNMKYKVVGGAPDACIG